MKISNKVNEIRIEDISTDIEPSCVYLIRNLHNGKAYVGMASDAGQSEDEERFGRGRINCARQPGRESGDWEMNNNMNINLNEDLKRHFPPMPEELRSMVEQEVRKQIGAAPPVRRHKYRKRKILGATLAAAMLLGTTVAAGA